MDRRAFSIGVAAAAVTLSSARAQDNTAARFDPAFAPVPEEPVLPREFLALQERLGGRLSALPLREKLDLLPRVPGELVNVLGAQISWSDWTFFDDQGVFAALFGDGLDDESLLGLIGFTSDARPSASLYSLAAAPFALPAGYVAYEALTRYAYISGAAPASQGGLYGDYAVAIDAADTFDSLLARLAASQRSWNDYVGRYGARSVNRL